MEQPRRLRSRVAKLKTKLDGGELRSRPGEQQITVAHRMQGTGAAKGAADLVTADGFADMVHDDESSAGGIRCNFCIPGFSSSAVGILIVPTQASILSRCRAPRCDRRTVRPKRNLRKRLENNLRTSGEKIVTRYKMLREYMRPIPR